MGSPASTIAILTPWADDFARRRYLLKLFVPHWQKMGHQVIVVTDEEPFVPASVAILHADITVISDASRRLASRYPRVVNGATLDIRKRRYSRLRLREPGPESFPVIVKTDWNAGGGQELRLSILKRPLGRLLRRFRLERFVLRQVLSLEARRPWHSRRVLGRRSYLVFPDARSVPSGVWRNPNLIVERFLAERHDGFYCCRHWLFFGDREVTRRSLSTNPIVKFDARLEPSSDPVPEELRLLRKRLGFDYGKFDFGIIDGEVHLYDANRTPGAMADPGYHSETTRVLSEGIRSFLEASPLAITRPD
jgi:hypothetical protein